MGNFLEKTATNIGSTINKMKIAENTKIFVKKSGDLISEKSKEVYVIIF